MGKQNRYPAEIRERAVRLVFETRSEQAFANGFVRLRRIEAFELD